MTELATIRPDETIDEIMQMRRRAAQAHDNNSRDLDDRFVRGGVVVCGFVLRKSPYPNDYYWGFELLITNANQSQLKKHIFDGKLRLPVVWGKDDVPPESELEDFHLVPWTQGMTVWVKARRRFVDRLHMGDFVECHNCQWKKSIEKDKDDAGEDKKGVDRGEDVSGGVKAHRVFAEIECCPDARNSPSPACFFNLLVSQKVINTWIFPIEDKNTDHSKDFHPKEENDEHRTAENGTKKKKAEYGQTLLVRVNDSFAFSDYDNRIHFYKTVSDKPHINPPKGSSIPDESNPWLRKMKNGDMTPNFYVRITVLQKPFDDVEAKYQQTYTLCIRGWPEALSCLDIGKDATTWAVLGKTIFDPEAEFEYALMARVNVNETQDADPNKYRICELAWMIADVPKHYKKIGLKVTSASCTFNDNPKKMAVDPKKIDVVRLWGESQYNTGPLQTETEVEFVALLGIQSSVLRVVRPLLEKMSPETGDKIVSILKSWSIKTGDKYRKFDTVFTNDEDIFLQKIAIVLTDKPPVMAMFALFPKAPVSDKEHLLVDAGLMPERNFDLIEDADSPEATQPNDEGGGSESEPDMKRNKVEYVD